MFVNRTSSLFPFPLDEASRHTGGDGGGGGVRIATRALAATHENSTVLPQIVISAFKCVGGISHGYTLALPLISFGSNLGIADAEAGQRLNVLTILLNWRYSSFQPISI